MGFPDSVEQKALIACKRHCCLCEKNVKTKIELHHIKQKSLGGQNTFDNCIPLCFNCHAEVGSYNVGHPKGKKYSEGELKKIRDNFYLKVERGQIESKSINDSDSDKIGLFKQDMTDIIEEIVGLDFAAAPFRITLKDDVDAILEKWGKRKYIFEDKNIDFYKNEITKQLRLLSSYLGGENDYFHMIHDNRLMFNNDPIEKLDELRTGSYQIREELNNLLNKIYEY